MTAQQAKRIDKDFEKMFEQWLIGNKLHKQSFDNILRMKDRARQWFIKGLLYTVKK